MDIDLSQYLQGGKLDTLYQERIRWVEALKPHRDKKKGSRIPERLITIPRTLSKLKELATLDSSVEVPLIILDYKYHPCAIDLDSLRKVTISNLEIENRHHGTVLVVRRIGPVTQTWSRLLVAVEDEHANSLVLTFNQHMREVPAEEFIPEGAVLAIKEPHLHIDSAHHALDKGTPEEASHMLTCVLRVDHPADLVVLSSDKLVPFQWRTETTPRSAVSWKEQGNSAFAERRFLQAHRCYTEGIKLTTGSQSAHDVAADLYRNRARTGLSLSFYDDAKSDALKSVSLLPGVDERSTELNSKAFIRAATAAYHLGCFVESETLLGQLSDVAHDDRASTTLANKIKQRLQEQAHGSYNFDKIRARIQDCGKIDAASFTRNIEVRTLPGGGTGLFATKDIQAGDLVLCEKALAIVTPQDAQAKPAHLLIMMDDHHMSVCEEYDAALWKLAIDKVSRNKSIMSRLDDIDTRSYAVHCGTHPRPTEGASDDVFFLSKIVTGHSQRAAHAEELHSDKKPGFWVQQSQMNHSCMPNTASAFIGDLVVVRATRVIGKDEQLFTRRCGLQTEYKDMGALMKPGPQGHYTCDCAICVAEQQTSPAQRTARHEVLESLAEFAVSVQNLRGKKDRAYADLLMKQAFEYEKKLSATYDDGSFTDVMPRRGFSLLYGHMEAIRLHQLKYIIVDPRQDVKKPLTFLLKALKAQGCEVTIDPAGNVSFANRYHTDLPWTGSILQQCFKVAFMSGHIHTGQQFLALAKETHLLLHCDLAGFPLSG